jgi:hypothetical protein
MAKGEIHTVLGHFRFHIRPEGVILQETCAGRRLPNRGSANRSSGTQGSRGGKTLPKRRDRGPVAAFREEIEQWNVRNICASPFGGYLRLRRAGAPARRAKGEFGWQTGNCHRPDACRSILQPSLPENQIKEAAPCLHAGLRRGMHAPRPYPGGHAAIPHSPPPPPGTPIAQG